MYLLSALFLPLALYVLGVYSSGQRVSPDGRQYLLAGKGGPIPSPIHKRWLVPLLCRANEHAWRVFTGVCLVLTGPVLFLYLQGWGIDEPHALFGVALFAGSALFRTHVFYPVLVDAPAMLFAVAAAVMAPYDIRLAVLLATAACTMKESAAVFAACFALNPWLLVGLAGLVPSLWMRHGPPELDPVLAGHESHAHKWFAPEYMLLPWGAGLLALFNPGWLLITIFPAYGQLLFATDAVRLYQWALPAVVAMASPVLPVWALLPVAALHIWNPFLTKAPL